MERLLDKLEKRERKTLDILKLKMLKAEKGRDTSGTKHILRVQQSCVPPPLLSKSIPFKNNFLCDVSEKLKINGIILTIMVKRKINFLKIREF